MPNFTFDVKAFVTVYVTAEDEATARALVDNHLPGMLEGATKVVPDSAHGLEINSASLDGEHDLVEEDEHAISARVSEIDAELNAEDDAKVARLNAAVPGWRDRRHPNGAPMFTPSGTMLDERGNRSIFDDLDE